MMNLKTSIFPKIGEDPKTIAAKVYSLTQDAQQFKDGLYRGAGLDFKLQSDYRFHKGWQEVNQRSSKVNHTTRLVARMTRIAVSDLYKGMFEPKVVANWENDVEKAHLANYVLKEQAKLSGLNKSWTIFTRDKVLHGTGLMRKEWFKKEVKIKSRKKGRDPYGDPYFNVAERDEILYEGWKNFNVFLGNFFWDPNGNDMESCSWVAENDFAFRFEDIKRYQEMGVFDFDKKTEAEVERAHGLNIGDRNDTHRSDYITVPPNQLNIESAKLTRYYTDEECFYVLNDAILLNHSKESQENPYKIRHKHRKPYIHSTFIENGEFLGEGIPELAGSYQHYSSLAVDLWIEQMYEIRRKYFVEENAIEDMSVVRDETNMVIETNDNTGIKVVDGVTTEGNALSLKNALEQDAEYDTGITKMKMGDRMGGNTTATEAAGVQESLTAQQGLPEASQLMAAQEDILMSCELNRLFLDGARVIFKGKGIQLDGTIFDLEDLTIDVVPESFLNKADALQQKRIEIVQQRLAGKPWAKLRELDIESVRAAGYEPERFIMPEEQPQAPDLQEEEVRGQQQAGGALGSPAQGDNLNGMTNSSQPVPPSGASAEALQGLNPQGMGGSPNVELGETAREAVIGQ